MTRRIQPKAEGIESLDFGCRMVDELPGDPELENYPRQVYGACYSFVRPAIVPKPERVAFSSEMAAEFGLNEDDCHAPAFAEVLSGNRLLPGMQPHATCYGGHQFGHWAGQLGDGRAINLGETRNLSGEWQTLQLKGAGRTPYSRSADGLAVLRSSIREFLCSEAMHHLGIPTTRALSLVMTGQDVIRDMFYDGHPRREPGAIVCRVAPSFTRFGHVEIFTSRGDTGLLEQFVGFTVRHDFPHLASGQSPAATCIALFEEVCRRTAELIVHWQRVGFVHGVMNTDNMSMLGLTIDYGPYGWIDDYNPDWTPNTTDAAGRRYRFGHQPQIAHWNLVKLANALYPLIRETAPLESALSVFAETFETNWRSMMAAKLGLEQRVPGSDDDLINEWLNLLPLVETDMTIIYRQLACISPALAGADDQVLLNTLRDAWYAPDELTPEYRQRVLHWLRRYIARLQADGLSDDVRVKRMNATNPRYVLRNYLAQEAIDLAEGGDYSGISALLRVLRNPYAEQSGCEKFAGKRPDWARNRPGCSMLSCSS